MTDVVPAPAKLDLEDGDHDRFAHWANKAAIARGSIEGTPVIALCGKQFVPLRDPERFPMCPECQRIYDMRGSRSAN